MRRERLIRLPNCASVTIKIRWRFKRHTIAIRRMGNRQHSACSNKRGAIALASGDA